MEQKLARHHDPKLTANTYTHLELHDKAAAIDSLPAPPEGRTTEQEIVALPAEHVLRATGTDDAQPETLSCARHGMPHGMP